MVPAVEIGEGRLLFYFFALLCSNRVPLQVVVPLFRLASENPENLLLLLLVAWCCVTALETGRALAMQLASLRYHDIL